MLGPMSDPASARAETAPRGNARPPSDGLTIGRRSLGKILAAVVTIATSVAGGVGGHAWAGHQTDERVTSLQKQLDDHAAREDARHLALAQDNAQRDRDIVAMRENYAAIKQSLEDLKDSVHELKTALIAPADYRHPRAPPTYPRRGDHPQ